MCVLESWQRDCYHTGSSFVGSAGTKVNKKERESFKKGFEKSLKSNKKDDVKTQEVGRQQEKRTVAAGEAKTKPPNWGESFHLGGRDI